MPNILSKLLGPPVDVSCYTYVHPWKESCSIAIAGCFLYCIIESLRIYSTVYIFSLLMKGRVPTKKDLRNTIHGIIQSSAFLSFTGFGYSFFLCGLRRVLGNFNVLSVSFLPAFLSSVFSILIERPSRRTLLCLYVSNIATETVWNMAVSRNLVRNINHGDMGLFGISMAILLTYYKKGYHKDVSDSMFKVLRFVVGPHEAKETSPRPVAMEPNTFTRQPVANMSSDPGKKPKKNVVLALVLQMLRIYKKFIHKVKCWGRHSSCPHPFSCLYYVTEGTTKMFSVGLAIQITLKLVLNLKRITSSPKNIKQIFFRPDMINLGLFLGLYSGLFRGSLCVMRRIFGMDDPFMAFPASLIASLAFKKYPDTTVALYVMWKAAQITYNLGIQKGYLPKVPGFTEFLYCLSTGILFHAALIEPTNLRPSYWKFLHTISGGRIACMAREPLDVFGLKTSESLIKVLKSTKTVPVVYF
ncbi:transmembrane protein 135-like isoform X1 [Rhynchophorus ferrugineus]|uniref:transmembrane protein 135-like isoform X1 n=2 Tax=Rhynchophorus ferrugineus TaxID=354439 RepID=UPI003FCE5CFC